MDILAAILSLIAGIGVFLIACTLLSSNLESICSKKLRDLFSRASDKKLVGVGIGALGTAAIQSSGATTVLVIGFVNAGIMSLTLAAAVIYGANIGTTITAQIVAFGLLGSDNTISLSLIFSAFTGIGAFINAYAKKDRTKKIGGVIAGFGLLFVGLTLMEDAMGGLSELDSVKDFLGGIDNIILLVIIGAALTAVVQSSSVMTTIIIAMLVVANPLITLEQGIYLTMGSNIGSCVVAIMAGFTSGVNARRTAMIHLLFNVIGVTIFVVFGAVMGLFTGGDVTYGSIFSGLFDKPATQLAMFHTFFNVVTVIIMLPLTSWLIKLVTKIIPDKKPKLIPEDEHGAHLYYLDENMLKTPAVAVLEVKNEIIKMAEFAMDNVQRASRIVRTLDFSEKEKFDLVENQIDYMNFAISQFLIKLSNQTLSSRDVTYISTAFHSITDLERIGDYAVNIVEYAEKLQSTNERFSDTADTEIEQITDTVQKLYETVMDAYRNNSEQALQDAYEIEETVDEVTEMMADHHIKRLAEGSCLPSVGAEFLSLTSDVERIADHFINVGRTIRDVHRSRFDRGRLFPDGCIRRLVVRVVCSVVWHYGFLRDAPQTDGHPA